MDELKNVGFLTSSTFFKVINWVIISKKINKLSFLDLSQVIRDNKKEKCGLVIRDRVSGY